MDEKAMWEAAAVHYQETIAADDGGYPERLMAFLRSCGAVRPGYRVADIGCGAGKYAIRFAKEGCPLLLVDISDNMMGYTLQNVEDACIPVEAAVCDFGAVDLAERGWNGRVELAFAAMTPAVKGEEGLKKLCALSTRFCFMSRFAYYDNLLQNSVRAECGVKNKCFGGGGAEECAEAVRQLASMGYFPELRFVDYGWKNEMSAAEAEERFFDGFNEAIPDTPEMRAAARRAIVRRANNEGVVTEEVRAKAAWILWDVTDKRIKEEEK